MEYIENLYYFEENFIETLDELPEDIIIMQCTGLKDKDGELIYEGDIVQILGDEIPYIIEYEQDRAMYIIHSKIDRVCCSFDNYNGSELEVIGNIYENKKLIRGKK